MVEIKNWWKRKIVNNKICPKKKIGPRKKLSKNSNIQRYSKPKKLVEILLLVSKLSK